MLTFNDVGLQPELLRAIQEMGFVNPTPVQEKTIPALLNQEEENSGDYLVLAQTGTGKTAAFGLPLLQLTDGNSKYPTGLILSPTRELCIQIANDLEKFSKFSNNARIVAVYGGASIQTQLKAIQNGANIIVATPGRLCDILTRKKSLLSDVQHVILDEADEMLNMGFKDELDTILETTPGDKKTWLFSATMPKEVRRIASEYMHEPVEISTQQVNLTNQNIEHIYYLVHTKDRYNALKRLADYYPGIFAIVFCRTKAETQQVADMLIKDGYSADALHGDLSQAQREHVMKRYRARNLQMLVATDVAARGIDVNDVTHVINYQLPDEPEVYTHRSGRTARAGKTGICISIVAKKDVGKIKIIEKTSKINIEQEMVPGAKEVCENQLLHLVEKLHYAEVNEEEILPYIPKVLEELSELNREELIKRFVSIEFNRFLQYYRNAPDLNDNASSDKSGSHGAKCFMTLGRLDGFDKDSMKKFIAQTANIDVSDIVWVDLKNSFSFVEIKHELLDKTITAFENVKFKGRKAVLEVRDSKGTEKRRERPDGGGRDNKRDYKRGRGSENNYEKRDDRRGERRSPDRERKNEKPEKLNSKQTLKKEVQKIGGDFKLDSALKALFAEDEMHKKGKKKSK